jgi:hypothetical protein
MQLGKLNILLLALLVAAMAMVPFVSATNGDDVYYKNILISSFGNLSGDMQKNIAVTNSVPDTWIDQLQKVTADADKDLDKYYYPNGPVIGHGYDMYGTMDVQINKDMKVDPTLIKEIYEVIKKDGERNGIKDIPCKFLSIGLMKVESRFDKIRPVVGGIELSSTNGWGTTGFRGRNSAGTLGIVTAGHIGTLNAAAYQPDSSVSGSYVGTISTLGTTLSDSAFIPYSNTAGTFYQSDGIYVTYLGYGDPITGQTVYKNGAATGLTSGSVLFFNSAYNPYLGKRLPNQAFASYSSASGDSGAPIYYKPSTFVNILTGIHMGSVDPGYGVFSTISAVDSDLGITPSL